MQGLSAELESQLADVFRDPVKFGRAILRADLWNTQAAVLRSIASNARTAVKACHASGKTFLAASAALWWMTRWPDGIVVTTAPTWTQVEKQLWGEIHAALRRSRIRYPQANQTELKLGPDNYALGMSTNEGVRFQGFHGNHILVILDEAPGVLPEIWEAIEGVRAGGNVHLLALGNPTVTGGPFHEAFTSNRERWATFTISAFDTPNLAGLTLETLRDLEPDELARTDRSYLVSRSWVREKFDEWGEGSPLWDARVLGNFPAQADDALIVLTWTEQASAREIAGKDDPLVAGVDVAGPGEDETVVYIRQGPKRIAEKAWSESDPRGQVAAFLGEHGVKKVNVDSAGMGWYFYQHLGDCGFDAQPVNVGEKSNDPEKYSNLKAELYWALRQRYQTGDMAGRDDEKTVAQLTSIRYKHDPRGRVVIESKDEMRKRGAKSPDRAEAKMLAFAPERQTASTLKVVGY